jgi:hypothetical protein
MKKYSNQIVKNAISSINCKNYYIKILRILKKRNNNWNTPINTNVIKYSMASNLALIIHSNSSKNMAFLKILSSNTTTSVNAICGHSSIMQSFIASAVISLVTLSSHSSTSVRRSSSHFVASIPHLKIHSN